LAGLYFRIARLARDAHQVVSLIDSVKHFLDVTDRKTI
jgi:hypothetical protein